MILTYDSPLATFDDARYTFDGVFVPQIGPLVVDGCFLALLARRRFQVRRARRAYVVRAVCRSGARVSAAKWPPKAPAETLVATFDFSDELDTGETLTTVELSCQVESGVDAAPGLVLYGPETIEPTRVLQPFSAGIEGVTYKMICTAMTSAGRQLTCAGIFAVRRP